MKTNKSILTQLDDNAMPSYDELTAQGSIFSMHEDNMTTLLPKGQGKANTTFKSRINWDRDITLSKERINEIFMEEIAKWNKSQKKVRQ